ncbi:hypothetical protein Q4Q39_20510 [Flavivirga amylovorans]|uniref:Lipocalin-like domain-containing protein n=1 Tax=Flavivirga amylovorans TaxID=870486 RepID=A0ABT8X766_9FLAO|nr:hypothetical protein [Flavivirga amylovorans]MDO5989792.1 hypothetical protein [Flavivirga amylovorans]
MKKYFLIVLSSLFLFTSCSVDNNNPEPQTVIAQWNLIKTTGGIAGVNDEFSLKTIVWVFNEVDFEIEVENKNTDDTKQDALDSGTYSYSVKNVEGKSFLTIDGDEIGRYTITGNKLVIDQNDQSEGSGADGFVYTFERTIQVVE